MTAIASLWHGVPPQLESDIIVSLAGLRKLNPEVAAKAAAKYQGREALTKMHIPLLGCNWDEVIFMSPYHPNDIYRSYREAGFSPPPSKWFEIPIDKIGRDRIAILPIHGPGNWAELLTEATIIDPATLPMHLPERQIQEYKDAFAEKRRPFILAHSPHVVVAAKPNGDDLQGIDTKGLKIIEWSRNSAQDVGRT